MAQFKLVVTSQGAADPEHEAQLIELICHTPMSNDPFVFSLAALALPLLSCCTMHWQHAWSHPYLEHSSAIFT